MPIDDRRAVVTVGVGPEQAESPALINALAPRDEVPDPGTFELANANAARPALLDAGFASVATADIAFDVDFDSEADAVAAREPGLPLLSREAWAVTGQADQTITG